MSARSFQPDDLAHRFHSRIGIQQNRLVLRSRLRRWTVGPLLLLLLAGGATLYYYTRPARIIASTEAYLSLWINGRVDIEDGSFSIFDGIRLHNVSVFTHPDAGGDSAMNRKAVFHCSLLSLRFDPMAVLLGRLKVSEIQAAGAHFTVISDPRTQRTNISNLLDGTRAFGPHYGVGVSDFGFPRIRMPNTRFSFYERRGSDLHLEQETRIDLWAVQRRIKEPVYDLIWRDRNTREQIGRARLELPTGALRFEPGASPPWLPVDYVIASIPITDKDIERWIQLLGIEGNVRIQDLAVGQTAGSPLGASGKILLRQARLSVPINPEEQQLSADERLFTLKNVDGFVAVTAGGVHAEFQGDLRGRRCETTLDIHDLPPEINHFSEAAWDLRVSCADFLLLRNDPVRYPAEAAAVRLWPAIARFYEEFDPSGRTRLSCHIRKEPGREAQPRLEQADFEALGCSGRYRGFPYALGELSGKVHFDESGGFEVRNMIGRHGPGVITLNGHSSGFTPHSEVFFKIEAQHGVLDAELYAALPEPHRTALELFELSGTADLTVIVERPGSATETSPAPVDVRIRGRLLDGAARYAHFPYPIQDLHGEFEVDDGLTLRDIRGRQGPATVRVEGGSQGDGQGGQAIDVRLSAERIALDELLYEALPQSWRGILDQLHLTGWGRVTGRVFRTPDMTRTTFDLDIAVTDCGLRYDPLPYALSGCSARLVVTPDALRVREFRGAHGPAVVEGQADVDFTVDPPLVAIDVNAAAVLLEPELFDALPGAFQKACRRVQPEGTVDLQVQYHVGGAPPIASPQLLCHIKPRAVRARYDLFPLPVRDLGGEIVVRDDHIEFNDLTAAFDHGALRVNGTVEHQGEHRLGTLRISASDVAFDPSLRAALPAELQRLWTHLNPTGRFDMTLDTLQFEHAPDRPTHWSLAGNLLLRNAGLDAGLRLRRLNGAVSFAAGSDPVGRQRLVEGKLMLDNLTINRARLTDCGGQLVFDEALGLIALRNLRATLYGGALTASVMIAPDSRGTRYDAVCRLTDVQLEPLLRDRRSGPTIDDPELAGLLNASVSLSGPAGDGSRRQGWGRVVVSDAQMYRLPLVLSILNVINLTIPEQGAFQDGEFSFTIAGDTTYLDDIKLYGTAMTLTGSGAMSLPKQSLDLELVISGPRQAIKIPLLTQLLEGAARELFEVRVSGPIDDPDISTRPLRGLRRLFAPRRSR